MRLSLVVGLAFVMSTGFAEAQERFSIGLRPSIVLASGEPANDIIATGLFARYRVSERWLIGAAVDRAEFDFELPWRVVGVEQDSAVSPIDALVTSDMFSAWLEREHGRTDSPWKFFWSVGAGYASPEVGSVTGPVKGGGTFDLRTDAGTEVVGLLAGGVRRNVGRHVAVEFAVRADHHLSEWKVTDRISGRTGSTDDYTAFGGHLGLAFRF